MANVDIRVGKKDSTFFSANPTLVLKDGQFIFNETTSELFIGDGVTQLSSLVAINGASYTLTASEIGSVINGAASATPNDTDLVISVESSVAKKNTWTQIKSFLKTYFDTVYTTTSAVASQITSALSGYVNTSGLTTNYIPKASDSDTLSNSVIYDDGTNIGIGTTSPTKKLDVNGDALVNGVIVGKGAASGTFNTAIGVNALVSNVSSSRNTAVGYNTLGAVSSNSGNTAVGYSALGSTTGSNNTALGSDALASNNLGSGNVGVGKDALVSNTSGNNNIAIGSTQTLTTNTSGNQNIALGGYALASQNSVDNSIAIGWASLYSNASGSGNVALGYDSLRNATGGNNTAVGYQAGDSQVAGSNNTFLGNSADATTSGLSNATAVGYNAQVSQSNTVILGNGADVGVGLSTPSARLHVKGSTSVGVLSTDFAAKFDNSSNQEILHLRNDRAALFYGVVNLSDALNEAKSTLASASTVNIGAASNYINITGTTTITAFDTVQAGTRRILNFSDSLTLTHNATTLILPYGANIITQAGDCAVFVSEGSGNWRCTSYTQTVTNGTWSPSWTGFSANPNVAVAKYTLQGNVCTVWLYAGVGTSNTTAKTVTLPFAAADSNIRSIQSITNNGTNAAGLISTTASSNILTCYATAAGGAWTASGNATVSLGGFSYIIA